MQELLELNNKKRDNPVKNGPKILRCFIKETMQMVNNHAKKASDHMSSENNELKQQ